MHLFHQCMLCKLQIQIHTHTHTHTYLIISASLLPASLQCINRGLRNSTASATCARTHTHTHAHIYSQTHTQTHTFRHTGITACRERPSAVQYSLCVPLYARLYVCYVFVFVRARLHMCACVCVSCVCVCVRPQTCLSNHSSCTAGGLKLRLKSNPVSPTATHLGSDSRARRLSSVLHTQACAHIHTQTHTHMLGCNTANRVLLQVQVLTAFTAGHVCVCVWTHVWSHDLASCGCTPAVKNRG